MMFFACRRLVVVVLSADTDESYSGQADSCRDKTCATIPESFHCLAHAVLIYADGSTSDPVNQTQEDEYDV